MIGTTDPSSPAASPVSVRYPGSSAGSGAGCSSSWATSCSTPGGVESGGLFSVTSAISLGKHSLDRAQERWG